MRDQPPFVAGPDDVLYYPTPLALGQGKLRQNFYGYRRWGSWGEGLRGHGNFLWVPGENVAVCGRGGNHRPPGSGTECSSPGCGFYGYKEPEFLPNDGSAGAFGTILQYGKVIEHETGYRSEKAKIVRLVVPQTGPWRMIAAQYGAENVYVIPDPNNVDSDRLLDILRMED